MREAQYAAPDATPILMVADWEHLLNAVKTRLRQAVEALPAADAAAARSNGHAAGLQASVLESVAALDQLHAMLAHDLGRRHCLSAFDDRFALGRAAPAGRSHPPLALMYVDLGDLHSIGQTHGSEAGDEVLVAVAARLTGVLRVQDIVRHLGGHAFACLLDGLSDREELDALAEQLVEAVSAPLRIGDLDVTVRPTVGIATSLTDGNSAATLFRCADAAMMQARRQQTAYAFFEERIDG